FEDDATFLMARGPEPSGRRVHGKAAIRKVLADRFKVISDMRWDHIEHFVAGSRAVAVWMVTGTGTDGEKLNYQGCDIYEVRGERVPKQETYWKNVGGKDRLSEPRREASPPFRSSPGDSVARAKPALGAEHLSGSGWSRASCALSPTDS